MKTLVSFSFLFLLVGCTGLGVKQDPRRSTPAAAAPEVRDVPPEARLGDDLRKKIVVLPFLDSDLNRSQAVVEAARKVVVADLLRTRHFVIISNSDFPQDVKSYLKDSKEYDLAAVSKVAASMGVMAVMEGKVLEVRAKRIGDEIGLFRKVRASVDVTIQVRVFGAKSGKEILSTVRQATVEAETTRVGDTAGDRYLQEDPVLVAQGVRKAFRSAVPMMVRAVEKLSWEGRVAMISGDRIYVNAGRLSGLQVGDILKVVEEGEEIFDPETGAFIGYAPGRMKGTLEVVSYFGKDGSIGVIHSGSGFKENDRVELY